jgi:hypothetical protein
MPMPLPPGIDANFEFNSTRLLDERSTYKVNT